MRDEIYKIKGDEWSNMNGCLSHLLAMTENIGKDKLKNTSDNQENNHSLSNLFEHPSDTITKKYIFKDEATVTVEFNQDGKPTVKIDSLNNALINMITTAIEDLSFEVNINIEKTPKTPKTQKKSR